MSEYDSSVAQKYTELMAPAFVEGCRQPAENIATTSDLAVLRAWLLQPPINRQLDLVDWESSGLPTKTFGGIDDQNEDHDFTPRAYAGRLVAFAFDDAYQIIKLCELAVQTVEMPADSSMASLMLNGKENLLDIARMPDSYKSDMFKYFKYPELIEHCEGQAPPPAEEAVVIGRDNTGRWRFEWHPEIRKFIRDLWEEGRGCPAAKYVIEDGSRKLTMINYFWEKLVAQVYPEAIETQE